MARSECALIRAVAAIQALSAYDLSQIEGLDIGSPDGPDSPGARVLKGIRDLLWREAVNQEAFPDPAADYFEFLDSSDSWMPGDRQAWMVFAELCLFDSPYVRSRVGERRWLSTDDVRAALEHMAEKLVELLIRRYAPQG